ncbi:MAG: hypothetical protein IIY07_08315, partial [Thermoguttaceae bacterium]|nr:hypothetical protein [Thermoguttaceae bacterium]
LIRSGRYKRIIVGGGDHMSSMTNYEDRNTCPIFGDGAAIRRSAPTSKEKTMQNDAKLLAVADVRREYFAGKRAPSKREIVGWIERGTVEGVVLPGVLVNGKHYCRPRDVETFLRALSVEPVAERRDGDASRVSKRVADQAQRVAAALEVCRSFGVGTPKRTRNAK